MKRRTSAGFTIVELLVAVSVFAVVCLLAQRGLAQALRAGERLEGERAFRQGLSMAFLELEDDLRQARLRPVRDERGASVPALLGRPPRPPLGSELELTRGGGGRELGELLRVAYRLEGGALWRLSWRRLDRAPQDRPEARRLLRDVGALRLRYHGAAGWSERWPTHGEPAELPRGVEVTLSVEGRGEFTRVFSIHG